MLRTRVRAGLGLGLIGLLLSSSVRGYIHCLQLCKYPNP